MKRIRYSGRLLAVLFYFVVAQLGFAADLTVFAAASLSDSLKEIAGAYEAKSGDKLRFNFGASNALARQIKEGAPADIFFSADEAKMDELSSAGQIATDTRKTILSNTLVIVVYSDNGAAVKTPADLVRDSVPRIALAETKTVPAGIYAREYLQKLGIWEQLSRKVVPLDNVRATLAAVEAGNADAGIVYKTDALISKKVKVAFEVPAADGPKVAYPLAVVKDSKQPEAARRFAEYLASAEAMSVFSKYGFLAAK